MFRFFKKNKNQTNNTETAPQDDQALAAEQLAKEEAERIEAERIEAERIEAERIEAERIEAERIEAERIEAERIEAERIEAERIEAERIEAERIEAERIEAERIEAERIEAERIEAERIEAERIEAERVKTEKAKAKKEKPGFFSRLKQGLSKTSSGITDGMGSLVLGKKIIDDELLEELETRLLIADVGIETTTTILDKVTKQTKRKELSDANSLYDALADSMYDVLEPSEAPLDIDTSHEPFVILVVGVNGAGKTTTIGKLAKFYQDQGKSVMLAAGDTFRAAAVEQLQEWGNRNDIPVIAQGTGSDSASVVFDAVSAAKARNIDIIIADTAGRLHTQSNLMEELKKVKRVVKKVDETAPHETLLVVDGSTGQNAMNQAKAFNDAIELSGIAITKLDGTAKGGIVLSLAGQLKLPLRFIGVGEKIEDLRPFNARQFVDALLDR